MTLPPDASKPASKKVPRWSLVLALVPVLALTVGIPFANRLEPRVFGLPFLLAWIVAWILLTPPIMAAVHWLDRRR
ncbi:MAG: DUF3311 domain-containing protein [Rhodospirillales bacterium]|nr:DUF3311 domain-containing protein [Acetobacter sp.]